MIDRLIENKEKEFLFSNQKVTPTSLDCQPKLSVNRIDEHDC
jgi:hypothetical protein